MYLDDNLERLDSDIRTASLGREGCLMCVFLQIILNVRIKSDYLAIAGETCLDFLGNFTREFLALGARLKT